MNNNHLKGIILILVGIIIGMFAYYFGTQSNSVSMNKPTTEIVSPGDPTAISPMDTKNPTGVASDPKETLPAPRLIKDIGDIGKVNPQSGPASVAKTTPTSPKDPPKDPPPPPKPRTLAISIGAPDGAKVFLLKKGWDFAKENKTYNLFPGEYWVNALSNGSWANERQYDLTINGDKLETISRAPNGSEAFWFKITDSLELVTLSTPPAQPQPPAATPPAAPPQVQDKTPAAPPQDQAPVTASTEDRSFWASTALFTFGKKK